MPPLRRIALASAAIGAMAAAIAAPASAQDGGESPPEPPDYREDGPYLLVCIDDEELFDERNSEVGYNQRTINELLYTECVEDGGYSSIAEAVEAAEPGTRIRILPGKYTVDETIAPEVDDLQIEGTGDTPGEVVLAADSGRALAANDVSGLYLKGFTITGATTGLELNGVDGAVVEQVRATGNSDDGIAVTDSAAVDLTACGAEDNGGSGIAIDSTEAAVTECESSGNLAGITKSGAGAAVIQDNRLHGNATGLIVRDTDGDHRLEARGNYVWDNNADSTDTAPGGVGILLAEAAENTVAGNTIWNQQTAAIAVWGDPDIEDAVSHDNRVEGNTLGFSDTGQRFRNRLDLWWDGQGEANCFDEQNLHHTTPAALPDCGDGPAPDRLLSGPVKTLKLLQCGIDVEAPTGCDWFGAKFTDRLEVQVAVLFAAGVLFLSGLGWLGAARSAEPPPPMSMTFSAIATGCGALLLVLGSWSSRADYEALAIGLWGFGWILAGRSWFSSGMSVFGALTSLIGGLAILDAIDRGVWIIPVVPVPPAWMWLVLLPLWVLLALFSIVRRHPRPEPAPTVERTPSTIPAYNRFDW
ncbi:right-handed parallel beta-helix repeat-containing protein [Glycomyces salinus]|uniref:right-handed parallel beta-helix repeat-containing protein n=1 Tax=Glycomyces salinus TaxID=980294 RepID=UPI0018EDC215|nr:right-handed parallel beta-helix repeat-containing protein [Glycomyces salinus]